MDPLTVISLIFYAVTGTAFLVFWVVFLRLTVKAVAAGRFLDVLIGLAFTLFTLAGVVWAVYGLSDPTNYPWEPIARLLK